MNLWSHDKLVRLSDQELRDESLRLEGEMKQIRAVRLQIAGELDRRAENGILASEPQVVQVPELLVADVAVNGEPAPKSWRFWR